MVKHFRAAASSSAENQKKKPGKQKALLLQCWNTTSKIQKIYRSGFCLRLTFFWAFNSISLPKSQSNSTTSPSRVFSSSFSTKLVGTHNGSFHCDEALACFLLRLTHKFSAARIVRTRDPILKVLDVLDAVLDVGAVYDPIRDRFDHHQKGFVDVFGHGFGNKLSSAGLVYKHYGLEIIAKELHLDEGQQDVYRLYLAVYKNFIEAVDAIDNGVNQYDTHRPRYVDNTNLTSRIGRLNLDWGDLDQSEERENEAFQHAMTMAGSEFLETVRFHAISWLSAQSIVKECLAARQEIDSSGEIMVLTRSCPWKLHIFELEEEMKISPTIKYVIYQDERSGKWRVQAVAVSAGKFESRKPFPSPWRGLTDGEFSEVAGIPGCTFVHRR